MTERIVPGYPPHTSANLQSFFSSSHCCSPSSQTNSTQASIALFRARTSRNKRLCPFLFHTHMPSRWKPVNTGRGRGRDAMGQISNPKPCIFCNKVQWQVLSNRLQVEVQYGRMWLLGTGRHWNNSNWNVNRWIIRSTKVFIMCPFSSIHFLPLIRDWVTGASV